MFFELRFQKARLFPQFQKGKLITMGSNSKDKIIWEGEFQTDQSMSIDHDIYISSIDRPCDVCA